MTITSILGSLGTLNGLVRALPQLIKLNRAGEAYGVSVDTAATSSIVSFGWASYGVMTDQPYVCLATGASGLIFFLSRYWLCDLAVRPESLKLPRFGLVSYS